MKGKKLLSAILATSMIASTMFAAVPAMADDAGEVQEITWMFWDDLDATEDLISLGYKNVIERFNADYEGQYHVTPVTTNLEEYYPNLNAKVDAGQCPDVFIVSPGPNLDVYVEPGVAADITDYLNEDGWIDTFVGGEGAFTQQTYDDKIYAVPLNIAAACVFYNTEMFEEAGCEVPTTFEELLECCQKLQDAGYTPMTISAGTAWCLSMLAGYLCDREGVDLDALADGSESWVNDKTLKAGENLLALSQYFQETAASDSNDIATANFYDEDAAILLQGSWVIGQMNGASDEIEDKCGVFSFPVTDDESRNGVIAKSDSLAMSSTTEYPEACIALMKYFTDDTAQKYTAEVGGKIPVTNVEYDESVAPKQLAYVMDVFGNAGYTFGFYNESLLSTEAGSTFDDHMVAMYLGKETPEEAFQGVEDFYAENR